MRAASVAVLALVVLAGCGGDRTAGRRAAVDDYVRAANKVEQRAEPGIRTAGTVVGHIGATPLTAAETRKLNAASRDLAAAEAALRKLQPPPEAARLHQTLLRLYARERGLVQELRSFAIFLPAAQHVLAGARPDTAKGDGNVTTAQLAAYARRLRAAAAKLEALQAPAALRPWARDEGIHLRRVAAELDRLAEAVSAGDASAAKIIAVRYRRLIANGAAVSAAQRRALSAYNARVRALAGLRDQLARRQAALDRSTR